MTQEIIELESSKLMADSNGGRPTFYGAIGDRHYQVFCCKDGLLFLDILRSVNGKMTDAKFAIIGGLLGGMVGASVGMMLDQQAHESQAGIMQLCSSKSEDELFAMAKSRKNSFVVFYDEIKWAKLEAPSARQARKSTNTLQGRLTFKAKAIGKKMMEIHNANVMGVALDALPSRIGDRLVINAQFDEQVFCYFS